MLRPASLVAWVGLILVLLGGGLAMSAGADRTVEATAPFAGVDRVIIGHGAAGTVAVHGGNGSGAVVRTVTRSRPASPGWSRSTLVDGLLLLVADCPDSSCSIALDVMVPRGVPVDVVQREGDVVVDYLAGALSIDIQGEGSVRLRSVSGAIHATTSLGDVTGTRLTAPVVDVGSSFGGSVRLAFSGPFDHVRVARTLHGAVELAVLPGSYRVDAPPGTAIGPGVTPDPAAASAIELTGGGDPALAIHATTATG
jgi:hypothetical protein